MRRVPVWLVSDQSTATRERTSAEIDVTSVRCHNADEDDEHSRGIGRMSNIFSFRHAAPAPEPDPDEPPSRSLAPESLTSFVGREADIAQVRSLLNDPHVHLLTLTGPGGVGKTRLALEVVRQVEGEFADGVRIVRLASIRDPDLVPAVIAQALGLQRNGSASLIETIVQALAHRHLLLVLDNFEHLLNEPPVWLPGILVACPRVKMLVTSGTALNVGGEHRYAVPPLTTPEPPGGESAADNPAVELFVQRARAVRSSFALDPQRLETIAEVCRRLEGLPLAIELAAARANVFSPDQLLKRLDDRFSLLDSAKRDAPERQRSMRNAIDWSYDLLSEDEQRVFRQLSVFVGGFELTAADSVVDVTGASIVDIIGSLVDRSLLRLTDDQEARYVMLELLREYAREQLVGHEGEASPRERHARWYLDLARRASPFDPSQQVSWFHRLEHEHGNLNAALEWLEASSHFDELATLANHLRWYWFISGRETEGLMWYERVLAHEHDLPERELTDTLLFAGHFAGKLSIANADGYISSALERARSAGDTLREAEATFYLALMAENRGDNEDAGMAFRTAAELYRRTDVDWRDPVITYHLGVLAYAANDFERARHLLESAMSRLQDSSDSMVTPLGGSFLALVACELGDPQRAASLMVDILPRTDAEVRADDQIVLGAAAVVAVELGDPAAAARLFGLSHRSIAHPTLPERRAFEAAQATARQRLGNAAYEEAFESGRHMRLSQARSEIARLLAASPRPTTPDSLEGLTPREIQVLRLLASGMANQQIADELYISRKTASHHVASILYKLGVDSRTAAASVAIRSGLV